MKYFIILLIVSSSTINMAQTGLKSLKFLSADTGFTAGNEGVLKTVDGGLFWIPKLPPDYWKDIEILKNIGIVTGTGKIRRSTDRGETWNTVNSGTTNELRDIAFLNDSTIIVVGYHCILRSQDYGASWSSSAFPVYFLRVAFKDENTGIAVGYSGYSQACFYKTSDGGQTWQQGLLLPQYTTFTSIAHVSGDKWIMTEWSGNLYTSTDNGNNWTSRTFQYARLLDVCFKDEFIGLLFDVNYTYFSGLIRRTTDGGNTWVVCYDVPSGDFFEPVLSFTPPDYFYLLTDSWLKRSSNNGSSWDPVSVPVELVSFEVTSIGNKAALNWTTASEKNNFGFEIERFSGSGWITRGFVKGNGTTSETIMYSFIDEVTSPGRYMYRLKQTDFDGSFKYSDLVETEINPGQYSLLQNYPNPFNPSTVIEFTLPAAIHVQLIIYDALGREAERLLDNELPGGNHSVNFNAAGLPGGVYFCRLNAGDFTAILKMLFIK